ncbi:molybdopterin molybdenumtransferase MoeA, partial [Streptomyces sp. SID13726]|nr:molybdopterin molybdenumtransferase MoeA [Streptomyces sp. SID13726]
MTAARSLRTGDHTGQAEDADELDVEEALALVKEDNGRDGRSGHSAPAPAPAAAPPPQASGPVPRPDAHHRATPWPEARASAAR